MTPGDGYDLGKPSFDIQTAFWFAGRKCSLKESWFSHISPVAEPAALPNHGLESRATKMQWR
jgi:hypothetical protein